MTVRQTAADFPSTQAVFRRHGESSRPLARFGHLESLTHFAERRGVRIETLISELSSAASVPVEAKCRAAEKVHHAYVLAAMTITLSLGAGWGAWLLWQISAARSFPVAPAGRLVAHGEAQLWGFIALFIIGVSLRTVLQPAVRWWGRVVSHLPLVLILIGILAGLAWSVQPDAYLVLGKVSTAALLGAALCYSTLVAFVLRTKWPATWARAVMASGLWMTIWAITTAYMRHSVGGDGPIAYSDTQRLLLIELAVFGFAMNSIYGFGQMLLPGLLRVGSVNVAAVEISHWLHNAGVILVGLATAFEWHLGFRAVGCALVLIGAILFAIGIRGFVGRRRALDRAEKGAWPLDLYPPLAFFWLLVSLILITGGVIFELLGETTLPHAYMGAMRHALTVGFMTTLILGVGQRILPVFDHTVLALPQLAMPILLLISAGNALRVGSELLTMAGPSAYSIMPISAGLEWTALLLFAVNCILTMYRQDSLLSRGSVTERSSLATLLSQHPSIEDKLICCDSEYLMRTRSVPSELTLGTFAKIEGYEVHGLLESVNHWVREFSTRRVDDVPESSRLDIESCKCVP